MKAIVLAAGMGKRLGKYSLDKPKCMVEFAGKPIIEIQIETLRSLGIDDIVIIKGYKGDEIKIEGVRYAENWAYEKTNMVETLFSAKEELYGDVLVCYADIIYEKKILQAVTDSSDDVGIVCDKDYLPYWEARGALDDMESFVVKNQQVIELGSITRDSNKTKFRYVGLIKFSKEGIENLKSTYHKYENTTGEFFGSKSFRLAYMTSILSAMIKEGYTLSPIIISKGWLEFDTSGDIENYHEWAESGKIKEFIDLTDIPISF